MGLFSTSVTAYEMTTDELEAHYMPYYSELADAIYIAEGGKRARVPYGILSVPVRSKAEARKVCLRTIKRRHKSWLATRREEDFVDYLGRSYAPVNAKNDAKTGLNKNWSKNVKYHQ